MAYFTRPWTPIEWAHILSQVFFGNYAIPQVFRGLDWLSSISRSKIMPQNPKSGQKFYPLKGNQGLNNTLFVHGHNSPLE